MDLQTYANGNLKIDELVSNVEKLSIIGDLAIITLMISLKGIYNGATFEDRCRYICF